jgi:hypothetical protein
MSRIYGIYVGIKKNLPWTIFTIPTVGWSDVSLQLPSLTNTTIVDHGCRWQIWPPSAPHEAFCSTLTHQMDGRQPPEHADIIFEAVEGVHGPQNTLMLWQCIIAGTKERFRGVHILNPPKTTSAIWGGCCPSIRNIGTEHKASCGALGGCFRRRRPWLWWLWRQLCFVLRLLKHAMKTLKLVFY